MASTTGKKNIATKKSGHKSVTPPAVSLNPPPNAPTPGPYPYNGGTNSAKKTKSSSKFGGSPSVVKGSEFSVMPPANTPSLPSGDILTAAKKQKFGVAAGSGSTKASGAGVSSTGSAVNGNVMSAMQQVAQAKSALLAAVGAGGAGGGGSGSGSKKKSKPGPKKPSSAKKATKAGHPVDVATGYVVDDAVDLALPGPIPFVFARTYCSARSDERGPLGKGGWLHTFDQWVEPSEGGYLLEGGEGRQVWFEPREDGLWFDRAERLSLGVEQGGYFVYEHARRFIRRYRVLERGARAHLVSIEDSYGNAIALEYQGPRLVAIVDSAGREVRVTNDDLGRVTRLEVWAADPVAPPAFGPTKEAPPTLRRWVDYAYHPEGELASVTNALGFTARCEYDGLHRLVRAVLENGTSFRYAYDGDTSRCVLSVGDGGLHTLELERDEEAHTTRLSGSTEPRLYTWNDDGLVVREETLSGDWFIVREYDEDQYLVAEENALGERREWVHDARGNLVAEKDAAGNERAIELEGDLVRRVTEPDGQVTELGYDARGSVIAYRFPTGALVQVERDARGRVVRTVGPEGPLDAVEYDAAHNVAVERNARGAVTSYRHDALGSPVERIDPSGARGSIEYDALGNPALVRYADGGEARFEYEAMGHLSRAIDPQGGVTRYQYGGTGVLRRVVQPDGQTYELERDRDERLTRIVNPLREHYDLEYDEVGRVVRERTFDARVLDYQFDAGDHVTRVDYPDGDWREFSYDPLGNIVSDRADLGEIVYERDALGRVAKAIVHEPTGDVETAFERDAFGRVVRELQCGREVRYAYDALGRRVQREIGVEGAIVTRYLYDPDGGLAGVEHEGKRVAIQRDLQGREVRRHAYESAVDIGSSWDAGDRLSARRAVRTSAAGLTEVLAERSYQYDVMGRLKAVGDVRWGATAYRHDRVGQLLTALRGRHAEVFEYDPTGSLRRVLEGAGVPAGPAWDLAEGNRLKRTATERFEDDERGRRVAQVDLRDGATTEYAWDARDRLREVLLPDGRKARFTYDAYGRRVRRVVIPASRGDFDAMLALAQADGVEALPKLEVTDFVWDGDALAAEYAGQGAPSEAPTRVHVFQPGTFEPLLQAERGAVFVVVTDHLGMPKELIDPDGRVAWSASHSAFGKVVEAWSDPASRYAGVASPFRMAGQYADDAIGLCYVRFRWFDADHGRWLSPDPLGYVGGQNLLAWDGSPLDGVDPLGLCKAVADAEKALMQALVKLAMEQIKADPKSAKGLMTPGSYKHLKNGAKDRLYNATYGKAIERTVRDHIKGDPQLKPMIEHTGQTRGPNGRFAPSNDFESSASGKAYDVTTNRDVGAHQKRHENRRDQQPEYLPYDVPTNPMAF